MSLEFVELQRELAGRYSLEEETHRSPATLRFTARDVALDRAVVVELLRSKAAVDPDLRARFLAGARQAAGLFHPNIELVHAVDQMDGAVYVIRGTVQGDTLDRVVREEGPLPSTAVRRLMEEVAWALTHAHERGIAHGRLAPDRITVEPETGRFVVGGFATDWIVDPPPPAFRPPEEEVRDQNPTPRGDLWALGVCARFAFAGRASGEDALAPDLDETIAHCLEPRPEQRPESAADVVARVAAPGQLPATLPPSARRLLRRIRQFSPVAGIGLFVLYLARDGPAELWIAGLVAGAFGWMGTGLVRAARQILREGLDQDLVTRILEDEAWELSNHPDASPHWFQNLAIGCGGWLFWFTVIPFAVVLLIAVVSALGGGGLASLPALGDLGAATLLLVTFLFLAGPSEPVGSPRRWLNFGERMMVGRFGRLLFRLARVGLEEGKVPSLSSPDQPTVVVLSEAVEELLGSLPSGLREEFAEAPEVVRTLRDRVRNLQREERDLSEALRELSRGDPGGESPEFDPEEEAEFERRRGVRRELEAVLGEVREQVFALTRALEHVRLGLLRLGARAPDLEEVTGELTMHLERAGKIGLEVEELQRSRAEVRRLLEGTSSTPRRRDDRGG